MLSLFRVFELSCFRDWFTSLFNSRKAKSPGGTRKLETTKKCIPLWDWSPDSAQMTDRRSPAIFFTSLTSLPSVQKSSLLFRWNQPVAKIWCQSLIKFDRLRPSLVFHRLSSPVSVVFKFDRLRFSSSELRCTNGRLLTPYEPDAPKNSSNEPPRITPSPDDGVIRIKNCFQDVKDQCRF